MKNILLTLAVAATAFSIPSVANADDFQVSAGGTYLFDSSDTELSFPMATVRGTYYFTENWGVEAEGSFGLGSVDNYAGTGIDIDLSQQFGGYAIGRFKTGEKGEWFGRIGYRAGELDFSAGGLNGDTSYQGVSFGAGYSYFFNEGLGLRAEVTTSGASLDGNLKPEGNFTSVSVSMTYRFGAEK